MDDIEHQKEHEDPFDKFTKKDWFWYILISVGLILGTCIALVKCNAIML